MDTCACIKFDGKMHRGNRNGVKIIKNRNRKLILVTSSNERQKQKCVDLRDYKIFEPNLVHSSSTCLAACLSVPNSLTMKIQNGSGRHLKFRKLSITAEWIEVTAINVVERCNTAMRRWPYDQKSKPEVNCATSSNESLEHNDDRYLNQIWHRV